MSEVIDTHIQEYFDNKQQFKEVAVSKELFNSNDFELKTDVTHQEIVYISILKYSDDVLNSAGLFKVFQLYIDAYLKLKISMDRKSRIEYVDINKKDRFEDHLNKLNLFQNVMKTKQ